MNKEDITSKSESNGMLKKAGAEIRLSKEVFEQKIKELYPYIVQFCKHRFSETLSGTSLTTGDIAQGALENANRSYKNFKGDSNGLKSWLTRIAINYFLTHIRDTKKHNENRSQYSEDTIDPDLTPDKKLILKQQKEELYREIEKLPEKQRLALKLNLSEGVGSKEIAEITGENEGAIKTALSIARAKVLKAFGKETKYSDL